MLHVIGSDGVAVLGNATFINDGSCNWIATDRHTEIVTRTYQMHPGFVTNTFVYYTIPLLITRV